jgi:hypothetical protein
MEMNFANQLFTIKISDDCIIYSEKVPFGTYLNLIINEIDDPELDCCGLKSVLLSYFAHVIFIFKLFLRYILENEKC